MDIKANTADRKPPQGSKRTRSWDVDVSLEELVSWDVLEQFMQEFPDEASVKLDEARKTPPVSAPPAADGTLLPEDPSKGLDGTVTASTGTAAAHTSLSLGTLGSHPQLPGMQGHDGLSSSFGGSGALGASGICPGVWPPTNPGVPGFGGMPQPHFYPLQPPFGYPPQPSFHHPYSQLPPQLQSAAASCAHAQQQQSQPHVPGATQQVTTPGLSMCGLPPSVSMGWSSAMAGSLPHLCGSSGTTETRGETESFLAAMDSDAAAQRARSRGKVSTAADLASHVDSDPFPSALAADQASSNPPEKPAHKQRFVWTAELHRRFEAAVNTLGIENAKPQAISQLMNVEGCNAPTRQNIKSHLQKYRLLLQKRSRQNTNTPQSRAAPADSTTVPPTGQGTQGTVTTDCTSTVEPNLTVTTVTSTTSSLDQQTELEQHLQRQEMNLKVQMELQTKLHRQLLVQRQLQHQLEVICHSRDDKNAAHLKQNFLDSARGQATLALKNSLRDQLTKHVMMQQEMLQHLDTIVNTDPANKVPAATPEALGLGGLGPGGELSLDAGLEGTLGSLGDGLEDQKDAVFKVEDGSDDDVDEEDEAVLGHGDASAEATKLSEQLFNYCS